MKKVLVVALSALLILALFIPAMAEAAPTFTTTVSAAKVKQGETVTITVKVDKDLQVQGFAIYFAAIVGGQFEFVSGVWADQVKNNSMLASIVPAGQGVTAGAAPYTVAKGEICPLTVKAKADAAAAAAKAKA